MSITYAEVTETVEQTPAFAIRVRRPRNAERRAYPGRRGPRGGRANRDAFYVDASRYTDN